jgi:hypothetical protein
MRKIEARSFLLADPSMRCDRRPNGEMPGTFHGSWTCPKGDRSSRGVRAACPTCANSNAHKSKGPDPNKQFVQLSVSQNWGALPQDLRCSSRVAVPSSRACLPRTGRGPGVTSSPPEVGAAVTIVTASSASLVRIVSMPCLSLKLGRASWVQRGSHSNTSLLRRGEGLAQDMIHQRGICASW